MTSNKNENKKGTLPSSSNVTPENSADMDITIEFIPLDDMPVLHQSAPEKEITKPKTSNSSKKEHTKPKTSSSSKSEQVKSVRKSNDKKKQKRSLFKKGMYIYITFLCLVAITLLILLWGKLDHYQKNYDKEQASIAYEKDLKHAPQIYFEDLIANITSDDWVNYWKANQEYVLDTDETIKSYIDENITNVDYKLYKSPAHSAEVPKYLVAYNDKILASFTLKGKENNWSVDEVKISLSGNKTATIEAPSYCVVSCNGITLDESYIVSSASYNKVAGYEDQLVNPPVYNTYEVKNLIAEPELTVYSTEPIGQDNNNRFYKLSSNSQNNTYKQQAESFIKSLLYYYSMGKNSLSENAANAASHVASGSNASKTIYSSKDGLSWVSPTNANYVTETSEVFELSDNCIFVDVYYRNTNAASEDERNTTETYRVFFLDLGNGYKIYSFSNV